MWVRTVCAAIVAVLLLFSVDPPVILARPNLPCTLSNDGQQEQDGAPPGWTFECKCYVLNAQLGKYKCQWVQVPTSRSGSFLLTDGYAYGSSSLNLCVRLRSGISSDYYGAPDNDGISSVFSENYDTGCGTGQNKIQPSSQIKIQGWLQALINGVWTNCLSSGLKYNATQDAYLDTSANMFTVPDCGSHYYRMRTDGFVWEGSAWRGGSRYTGSIWAQ
jgi:hypothetical protein